MSKWLGFLWVSEYKVRKYTKYTKYPTMHSHDLTAIDKILYKSKNMHCVQVHCTVCNIFMFYFIQFWYPFLLFIFLHLSVWFLSVYFKNWIFGMQSEMKTIWIRMEVNIYNLEHYSHFFFKAFSFEWATMKR